MSSTPRRRRTLHNQMLADEHPERLPQPDFDRWQRGGRHAVCGERGPVLRSGGPAQVIDPFGHFWTIATHVEDVAPDEMERQLKEMTGGH